jgi:hypothetical protein
VSSARYWFHGDPPNRNGSKSNCNLWTRPGPRRLDGSEKQTLLASGAELSQRSGTVLGGQVQMESVSRGIAELSQRSGTVLGGQVQMESVSRGIQAGFVFLSVVTGVMGVVVTLSL